MKEVMIMSLYKYIGGKSWALRFRSSGKRVNVRDGKIIEVNEKEERELLDLMDNPNFIGLFEKIEEEKL